MKILVVGDSFCANTSKKSWTQKLKEKIPNSDITVNGAVGASLFYSYQQLLSLIKNNYDYYILLITNPGRLYSSQSPHFSNVYSAMKELKSNSTVINQNLKYRANATIEYYKYLQSDDLDIFLHKQLLREIELLLSDKKYILFPCFKSSGVSGPFTLYEILLKGFEPFAKNNLRYYQDVYATHIETENVINHHTEENQEILAEYFYEKIINDKSNININSFKSAKSPFSYYYKKIK